MADNRFELSVLQEEYLTITEISELLRVSYDYALDLFKDDDETLKIRRRRKNPHDRIKTTYRVPKSSFIRKCAQMRKGGGV